jgi:phage terminase large subunit-like protein
MTKNWSTACRDWEERIITGQSLIPCPPLFPDQAEAALEIFRDLRIVGAPGNPTMAEACRPWVFEFVASIFGAYDHESGRRLIRYFFLLIAKKNAKSTLAAGVMVTALIRNWRDSGEFYILAPTKEIADNSFIPARNMVLADENLRSILKPSSDTHRTITHRNTGAFLKVVAADQETVGGKKTIGLFIDEEWLFGKRANSENLFREAAGGLTSHPEGFVIKASTQSDAPPAGVFAQDLEYFRDVRDGKHHDPRSLGLLFEFPKRMIENEEYKKPENLYIPNPNLGLSVDEEYIADDRMKAERNGQASLIGHYAKHLNIQVGMAMRADGWAGAVVWQRGIEDGLSLEAILERSEVVTVGIDGGGLDDLLGVAVIGRERGTKRWLAWAHALISDIGMERRKANAEKYNEFERDKDLTKFVYVAPEEGQRTILAENIKYVVDLVKKIRDRGLLAQVGVDAAGIGAIVDALANIGVTQDAQTLDAVRQGIALMGAIKTIEIKLADYSFRHGGSAMLKWCVGNLRMMPTPTAMRVARDEAGYGKIDPMMAVFNAAHLMSLNPDAECLSVYDQLARSAHSAVDRVHDDDVDMSILRNPLHPRWQEVMNRHNLALARADDDDDDDGVF